MLSTTIMLNYIAAMFLNILHRSTYQALVYNAQGGQMTWLCRMHLHPACVALAVNSDDGLKDRSEMQVCA